jgi:hypothetical protein
VEKVELNQRFPKWSNERGEDIMSAEAKKEYGSTLALLAFGVMALYFGIHWLIVLVPAATLVWLNAKPVARSGRS